MTRRTSEHNLRQAISEILEQVYALEYAMGLYYRKGGERDLARAQEDFEILRAAVDRLGTIVGDDREQEDQEPTVASPPHDATPRTAP
jgi:hypothetical protein